MRRVNPPVVEVFPLRDGFMVVHTANGKHEFLGADKLWHRRPEHCEPFTDQSLAEAKAERVRGGLA